MKPPKSTTKHLTNNYPVLALQILHRTDRRFGKVNKLYMYMDVCVYVYYKLYIYICTHRHVFICINGQCLDIKVCASFDKVFINTFVNLIMKCV